MTFKPSDKTRKYFRKRYEDSENFAEIFEVIKEGVEKIFGKSRSGLMLAFQDLGVKPNGFIGAFHPVGSNVIVMNKAILKIIEANRKDILKAYVFHVLMHEYLHTLGVLNERHTELFTYDVNLQLFGRDHEATRMSFNFDRILPEIILPEFAMMPRDRSIDVLNDFEETSYIG
jgi:predicted metalloprotease with PDZ domain